MADTTTRADTYTVLRSQLEQMHRALVATIDTNVMIEGLLRVANEDEYRTCLDTIEVCISNQARSVCPAADLVQTMLDSKGGSAPADLVAVAHRLASTLRIAADERDQLFAVLSAIEQELGELCNQGENPPDDAPLNAWRLAQVAKRLLESPEIDQALKAYRAAMKAPEAAS